MKTIEQLATSLTGAAITGNAKVTVLHLTYDSRQVGEGSMFFAVEGTQVGLNILIVLFCVLVYPEVVTSSKEFAFVVDHQEFVLFGVILNFQPLLNWLNQPI